MWDIQKKKKKNNQVHMCRSVAAACLKRMEEPTCEGVLCLLWEYVRCWDVGGL